MSGEEHYHKKKHLKKKIDGGKNERPESRLFTEADAKSVEVSGYTVGRGAPQNHQVMQSNGIPTGVVGIDESVKLPTPPSKSHQHPDIKPNTNIRFIENYQKESSHFPPINSQHYPNGYYQSLPDHQSYGQLSYPYPGYYDQYPSPHHHHNHHQHHHHHNHHQHHQKHHHHHHHKQIHKKKTETYDPRWWYMPLNSVHKPKAKQTSPEYHYHYAPPKWYETPSQHSGILIKVPESQRSPRKYLNCRCGVCNPSKEAPRGPRWVAYA